MKQFNLLISLFICCSAFAQENNSGIPIPMKNGIVFYEKSLPLNKPVSKGKIYSITQGWIKVSFPGSKEKINIDTKNGKIVSKGLFKIITDETTGHHYWIKPTIAITVNDDSCKIELFNYYEKPIMPGVTNDYSKIEYRWWDFRKGKPWNKEDQALFNGLHQNTEAFLLSFTNAIIK